MSNRLQKLRKYQESLGERSRRAGNSVRMVHGYMIYRCRACGNSWKMYLERGIEEPGENHKPSPFIIRCKCGGMAQDISGIVKLSHPMPLGDSMSYFRNDEKSKCGVSVVR